MSGVRTRSGSSSRETPALPLAQIAPWVDFSLGFPSIRTTFPSRTRTRIGQRTVHISQTLGTTFSVPRTSAAAAAGGLASSLTPTGIAATAVPAAATWRNVLRVGVMVMCCAAPPWR